MPTSDVYDVLIHFVRRDGLQDEGQREESFLQPRHQRGGADEGGRMEEGDGKDTADPTRPLRRAEETTC